jgi:hypothetical protein
LLSKPKSKKWISKGEHARFLGIVVSSVILTGCAAVSKVDSDGIYRFKSQGIEVWAPKECLLDIAVRNTGRSVDFTTGAGYWMASGQYALQLFHIPPGVTDSKTFIARVNPWHAVCDRAI